MATVRNACWAKGRDTLLAIRVQPGARREEPGDVRELPPVRAGESRTVVVWHVRARAVDGRANTALVRSVAECLGVPRSAVEIVRGQRARDKVLRVRDRPMPAVVAALAAPSA